MQVRLHQIGLKRAGQTVLDGLDLTTRENEYVVILGPSGCGKTTTLRIIAGLMRPDQGEVYFDGAPVTTVPPRRRSVAMVFQHDGLYPHLTIARSIRLGSSGRVTDSEVQARIDQAGELTRITGLLDRYPDQLSGGELRRAAVAKAIVRRSRVRLLDEPLAALDTSARYSLQDDLLHWHRTVPGTTIHVTHDGFEAMRMADRIAILDHGRITQFDSPASVYRAPASIAVARSIGSPPINLIPARVEQRTLVSRDRRVRVQVGRDTSDDGHDRDVYIGIRPESFRVIGANHTGSPTNSHGDDFNQGIEITTTLVEYRRGVRELYLCSQLDTLSIHALLPESFNDDSLAAGDTLRLRADATQLTLFDAESGNRFG